MTQRICRQSLTSRARNRQSGYSLVEALIVVAIGLILTAFSVVMVQSALRNYTVTSTANAVSRFIGVVRYTGITQGANRCILFAGNQFGADPDCNGAFLNDDQRVQVPAAMTVSQTTTLPLTSLPFNPAPTTVACSNFAVTFNTRGIKTSVCGTATGGAVTHVFFLSGWGITSAVTVTGTGRARSWQFINGAWQ
jgi:type II secretory pathway pseudopilin PulG